METADLSRTYQTRFAEKESYRAQVWQVLINAYFQKLVPTDAAVLDLGCGFGEFINQVSAGQRYGMDLNPDAGDHLQPGIEFLRQDCSAPWPVPENSLDVVFTSNFFEHLPDKGLLERTLQQAHRALKPGGCIICMGPNIRYLPGSYWDFWDHYLPLTELSLAEGLRLRGFRIERCIARFLPYSMSQGFAPPAFLLRLYLMLPVAWPFLGKQFLLVARK